MDTQRLNNWVQIGTSIVIIVGLLLVLVELRQAKQLAHAQIASDTWMYASDRQVALLGENPIESLVRACFEPAKLTYADLGVLDAYYRHRIGGVMRMHSVRALGGLTAGTIEPAFQSMSVIFSLEHGQRWWRASQTDYPQFIQDGGNAVLRDSTLRCDELLRRGLGKAAKASP